MIWDGDNRESEQSPFLDPVTVILPLQVYCKYHVGSLVVDGGWVHVHHGYHWIQAMIWDGENWESEQSPFLDPGDCHITSASISYWITGRGWGLGTCPSWLPLDPGDDMGWGELGE